MDIRRKGKIPNAEWSAIATRHSEGEPLAQIARDYGCTAPAIRYIVKRVSSARSVAPATGDKNPVSPGAAGAAATVEMRAATRKGGAQFETDAAHRGPLRLGKTVHERITGDIAAFLCVLDVASTDLTPENASRLRDAADRLMRSAARVRIELDRSIE